MLSPKRPGVKWFSEEGKNVELETVPGGSIMLNGWHASGGEGIWVEEPLKPGFFSKKSILYLIMLITFIAPEHFGQVEGYTSPDQVRDRLRSFEDEKNR